MKKKPIASFSEFNQAILDALHNLGQSLHISGEEHQIIKDAHISYIEITHELTNITALSDAKYNGARSVARKIRETRAAAP